MHRRLGEILVDAGVVDAQQLRAALAEAAQRGSRVGEVLVARGLCTEQAIVGALASQLQVPVAPLATTTFIAEPVLGMIPPQLAMERQVLPLFLDRRTGALEVAVADPTDHELLDELRFRTGHAIRPMVALPAELTEAIEEFYFRRRGEADGPFEHGPPDPSPPWQEGLEELDDSSPGSGSDSFIHGLGDGEDEGMRVRVERTPKPAPRTGSPTAPLADPPTDEHWPDEGPTLGEVPAFGAAPAADAEALRQRVEQLETRVTQLYGILREAAAAHQTLLGMLSERGLVDADAFRTAVQARLQRKKPS